MITITITQKGIEFLNRTTEEETPLYFY